MFVIYLVFAIDIRLGSILYKQTIEVSAMNFIGLQNKEQSFDCAVWMKPYRFSPMDLRERIRSHGRHRETLRKSKKTASEITSHCRDQAKSWN